MVPFSGLAILFDIFSGSKRPVTTQFSAPELVLLVWLVRSKGMLLRDCHYSCVLPINLCLGVAVPCFRPVVFGCRSPNLTICIGVIWVGLRWVDSRVADAVVCCWLSCMAVVDRSALELRRLSRSVSIYSTRLCESAIDKIDR